MAGVQGSVGVTAAVPSTARIAYLEEKSFRSPYECKDWDWSRPLATRTTLSGTVVVKAILCHSLALNVVLFVLGGLQCQGIATWVGTPVGDNSRNAML